MTLPADYVSDLLTGAAQLLNDAGVGVYHPDTTPYATTDLGIGIGGLPLDCDRALAVCDYLTTGDHPNQALGTVGFQIMARGARNDRNDTNAIRGAVFYVLHGLTNRDFGACHVIQLLRRTSIPMGQDASERWLNADNYYADVNPPATPYRNQ